MTTALPPVVKPSSQAIVDLDREYVLQNYGRYPLALVEGSPKPEAAKKFLDYLASEEAGQIFIRYGFLLRQ